MEWRKICTTVSIDLYNTARKHNLNWHDCLANGIVTMSKKEPDLLKRIGLLEENIKKYQQKVVKLYRKVGVLEQKP